MWCFLVNLDFGLWLLLVANIFCISNQEEAGEESPGTDKHKRVQEDVLDSALQGGEAELERCQDHIGIEDDESTKETHPAEVTGHEITQERLNLMVCVYSLVAVGDDTTTK